MKMNLKRLMAVSICIIILANSFATKVIASEKMEYKEQIQVAQVFIEELLKRDSYNRIVRMYDVNDELHYLLFDIGENGYAIIDIESCVVIEGSTTEICFDIDTNKKYYYNGPKEYYIRQGDIFINLYNQEEMNGDETQLFSVSKEKGEAQNTSENSRANVDYEVLLTNTLPNYYSLYLEGICASVAGAMFMQYLDDNMNENLVAGNVEDDVSGTTLINLLLSYIEPNYNAQHPAGADEVELKNGLQNYINARGVSYTVSKTSYTRSVFKSRIDNNRPVILGTVLPNSLTGHWVVAYGYHKTSNSSVDYIITNDGNGNSRYILYPGAIDWMVY